MFYIFDHIDFFMLLLIPEKNLEMLPYFWGTMSRLYIERVPLINMKILSFYSYLRASLDLMTSPQYSDTIVLGSM